MINEDIRHIIEAELQPGEELLWADRPVGLGATKEFIYCSYWLGGMYLMLFLSVFFYNIGVTIFALGIVAFGFFSIVLTFVFLPILVLRLINVSKQIYGVTEMRVIIINKFFGGKFNLSNKDIWWKDFEGNEDVGTIYLINQSPGILSKIRAPFPVLTKQISLGIRNQMLFNINNPKSVEALLPFRTLPWKG